ncbi:MAG TPA: nickel pincer cofactor biosynthesis protein LarC [Ilumatobacteraceae bacterium]|nr:nickel pincer cofactor biosynthesis protein LarC [Ilumatobacteraceae bacterium]
MTRTAWFHCFAGTAGDMTMAALVDAGADPLVVADIVGRLDLDGYALTFEAVMRCGVAATQAHVVEFDHAHSDDHEHHEHPHRGYREIRDLIDDADLPERVRDRAQRTFAMLADVEGKMHRMPTDEVEFHEVGSVDAIVDIVGTCAALESLDVERIVCSSITVGEGTVLAAHGQLPNPAPAVTELLARRNAPSRGIDDRKELATPTGVALMCALADEFGPMPAFNVSSVGYGAGTADIPGRPNVVQVVIGEAEAPSLVPEPGQIVRLLETNIDDATGEVIAHTIAALMTAGAHDAWATSIVMKKGRPAHTVHVLCEPSAAPLIGALLLRETGSLGLRGMELRRWPQQRTQRQVVIDGHIINAKVALGRVKVEYDDAAAAAAALGRPLRDVLAEASALAERDVQ